MQADLSITESLMISAKPLLPFKVTYPQVPGIRTGTFGGAVEGGRAGDGSEGASANPKGCG